MFIVYLCLIPAIYSGHLLLQAIDINDSSSFSNFCLSFDMIDKSAEQTVFIKNLCILVVLVSGT